MDLNLNKVSYLYKTPSKFYIQPVEQPNEALIIDRQTCEISSTNMFSISLLPTNSKSYLIYGLLGIKYLPCGPYLIVITRATQIGSINEMPIFRMDSTQIFPFNDITPPQKNSQTDWNNHYLSMLDSVLKVPNFYFSYSYDLTNTVQRNYDNNIMNKIAKVRVHLNYDRRFLWNSHLLKDFDRCGDLADRYRLPIILGFILTKSINLGQKTNFILISRRSARRAGTRFNCRGIDNAGNVANFVETEQIIEEFRSVLASHVQIRGSIPLIWRQKIDYSYHPEIEIDHQQDHDVPLKKHLSELQSLYGKISIVNLIDHKGREANLEREFSVRISQHQRHYDVNYHYFDFHKECSKMRWHRLSLLMGSIESEILSHGYFISVGQDIQKRQLGVFRVNCIDNLDRTNVVQSLIAQKILETQLSTYRFIPDGAKLSDFPDLLGLFKNAWADNADFLSIQYAGTAALKTDFTRTGHRSTIGTIKDGINSMTRYVSNNFLDQHRQDSIDLLLGNFEGYPSPLYRPMDLTSYTSPLPVTVVVLTFVVLFMYVRNLWS